MPRSKTTSLRELEALVENDCVGGRSQLSVYKTNTPETCEKATNRIYNYTDLKYFLQTNLKCKKCNSSIIIDEDIYLISLSLKIKCINALHKV